MPPLALLPGQPAGSPDINWPSMVGSGYDTPGSYGGSFFPQASGASTGSFLPNGMPGPNASPADWAGYNAWYQNLRNSPYGQDYINAQAQASGYNLDELQLQKDKLEQERQQMLQVGIPAQQANAAYQQGMLQLNQRAQQLDNDYRNRQLAQSGQQFQQSFGLQQELGRGQLGLQQELGRGQLGVSQGDLALRGQLGLGGLDLQRQGLIQQGQIAAGQQRNQLAQLALGASGPGDWGRYSDAIRGVNESGAVPSFFSGLQNNSLGNVGTQAPAAGNLPPGLTLSDLIGQANAGMPAPQTQPQFASGTNTGGVGQMVGPSVSPANMAPTGNAFSGQNQMLPYGQSPAGGAGGAFSDIHLQQQGSPANQAFGIGNGVDSVGVHAFGGGMSTMPVGGGPSTGWVRPGMQFPQPGQQSQQGFFRPRPPSMPGQMPPAPGANPMAQTDAATRALVARGGGSFAPGTLEALSPSERSMLSSRIGATGGSPDEFFGAYRRTRPANSFSYSA